MVADQGRCSIRNEKRDKATGLVHELQWKIVEMDMDEYLTSFDQEVPGSNPTQD